MYVPVPPVIENVVGNPEYMTAVAGRIVIFRGSTTSVEGETLPPQDARTEQASARKAARRAGGERRVMKALTWTFPVVGARTGRRARKFSGFYSQAPVSASSAHRGNSQPAPARPAGAGETSPGFRVRFVAVH